MNRVCSCGSENFFMEKKGTQTGMYCSVCGKWQKWMTKSEIRTLQQENSKKNSDKDIVKKLHACVKESTTQVPVTTYINVIDAEKFEKAINKLFK